MSKVREVVVDGRKAWVCNIDVGRPAIKLVFQDNGETVIAFREPERKGKHAAPKVQGADSVLQTSKLPSATTRSR